MKFIGSRCSDNSYRNTECRTQTFKSDKRFNCLLFCCDNIKFMVTIRCVNNMLGKIIFN